MENFNPTYFIYYKCSIFIFVIFANHTTTSDLLIPGLIAVELYFWLDKAYKIDKNNDFNNLNNKIKLND